MAASTAIYVGDIKGILGLDNNTFAGLIIDSISFGNTTQEHEYFDVNSDVFTIAFTTHQIEVSIDGRKLAGSSITGKVAAALALTTISNYLPSGYTGGTTLIKSMNESQAIGEYQNVNILATTYPKVI